MIILDFLKKLYFVNKMFNISLKDKISIGVSREMWKSNKVSLFFIKKSLLFKKKIVGIFSKKSFLISANCRFSTKIILTKKSLLLYLLKTYN